MANKNNKQISNNKQTNKNKPKSRYFKPKYSPTEKAAYYTGLGVGLTGQPPFTRANQTRKAVDMMSLKEFQSYSNGFGKGVDNTSIKVGSRKKGRWF